jgi:hypothetical protein
VNPQTMDSPAVTVKSEGTVCSTPTALPEAAVIAVTAEESSAGVESVAIVVARVDKSVNKRLMANIPLYVVALTPFVDSSQPSGLRMRTAAT